MAFKLRSPAFGPGGAIPRKYTGDGADVSPPLRWTGPPEGTKSFALTVDDRDGPTGTWVHWVLYAMAATVRELPEGVPREDTVASVGSQGLNDFGEIGYRGPCPPPRTGPSVPLQAVRPGHRPRHATAPAQSGPPKGLGGAHPRAGGSHRALPASVTEWRWSTGALERRFLNSVQTAGGTCGFGQ